MDNLIKIILIIIVVFMLLGCSCSCKKVEKFTDPDMFNRGITYKMIPCKTDCEYKNENGEEYGTCYVEEGKGKEKKKF